MILPAIWFRRLHRWLAIWTVLGLGVAVLSGVPLAWYASKCHIKTMDAPAVWGDTSIADFIDALGEHFTTLDDIEINTYGACSITGERHNGQHGTWGWDPEHALLSVLPQAPKWVQWMTALHRSFFLDTFGRIWAGVTAFLFLLLVLIGFLLTIQIHGRMWRRGGDWHVVLGMWVLLPSVVLTFTGATMSAIRFDLWNPSPPNKIDVTQATKPHVNPLDFEIFESSKIKELESLKWPFVMEEEESFEVRFRDGSRQDVNALTGQIVSRTSPSRGNTLQKWMTQVHTGEAHLALSLLWMATSFALIFLAGTGFAFWKSRRKVNKRTSMDAARHADLDIVVASQGGSTWRIAEEVASSFKRKGTVVNLIPFESFTPSHVTQKVIFMVATFGRGEAPEHLWQWRDCVGGWSFDKDSRLSIVAFGDKKYTEFAKFGNDLHEALEVVCGKPASLSVVHNRSELEIQAAVDAASGHLGLPLLNMAVKVEHKSESTLEFQVTQKVESGPMLWLRFKTYGKRLVPPQSGDLLTVRPPNNSHERLYSLSVFSNQTVGICVSLKLAGVCSSWLSTLEEGSIIHGNILENPDFHLPVGSSDSTTLLANGSGIGPFLGMIELLPDNACATLVWGLQEQSHGTFAMPFLSQALKRNALYRVEFALSNDSSAPSRRVQDVLCNSEKLTETMLSPSGCVMVCGSLGMAKEVEATLANKHKDAFMAKRHDGLWRSDCY